MITIDTGPYEVDLSPFLKKSELIATKLKMKGNVTIRLGDKEESRRLNLSYREKDDPTDVLSFPFNEDMEGAFYIGDIFICFPLAREQAEENNIPLGTELFILMLHGLLHLAGYDHETDSGEMMALQRQLIEELN
jgi:probable rRNA maturation factor